MSKVLGQLSAATSSAAPSLVSAARASSCAACTEFDVSRRQGPHRARYCDRPPAPALTLSLSARILRIRVAS